MKYLTKRQALIKHVAMWSWLAKHPEKRKPDYFSFKFKKLYSSQDDKIPYIFCYACQYAEQRARYSTKRECDFCLLVGYAWDKDGCMSPESLYLGWMVSVPRLDVRSRNAYQERSRYAQQMADAGKRALEDLRKGKK